MTSNAHLSTSSAGYESLNGDPNPSKSNYIKSVRLKLHLAKKNVDRTPTLSKSW